MAHLDGRWDALARGELSAEQEAALRGEADRSEELRAAWEAFRPLDANFRQGLVRRARRGLGLRRFRPPRSAASKLGGVLAMAAVLVLAVGLWRLMPNGGGPADLPTYGLEVRGGLAEQRSATGAGSAAVEPPRLAGELPLEVILIPRRAVEGGVAVTAFLERGDSLDPWHIPPERLEIADTGAIRIVVRADELGPRAEPVLGPVTLWLAVGRGASMPDRESVRALIAAGDSVGPMRLLRQDLVVEP